MGLGVNGVGKVRLNGGGDDKRGVHMTCCTLNFRSTGRGVKTTHGELIQKPISSGCPLPHVALQSKIVALDTHQ